MTITSSRHLGVRGTSRVALFTQSSTGRRSLRRPIGDLTVRPVLESHFISPSALAILLRNPFGPDDFEAFISERQRTLQEAIENLLVKERLDLPPQLRELDIAIERVELAIRAVIRDRLGNDANLVPGHVMQKVEERLGRAIRKNAAMDVEYYDSLSGKLEYFDLRELQDALVSKALWDLFEPRFANKDV